MDVSLFLLAVAGGAAAAQCGTCLPASDGQRTLLDFPVSSDFSWQPRALSVSKIKVIHIRTRRAYVAFDDAPNEHVS